MTADWQQTELGSVITLQRGFDLPIQDRGPGSVPVVSSSGISGTHSKAMVPAPGVVTGRYGTIGEVFYLEQDFWPLNTTLFVKDFQGNDPRFVFYLLKTVDFYSCNDKSSVPGVNRNHLHRLHVSVPASVAEQKAIANVLGLLDEKIDLNRRMNETLEAMARATFKTWFIDFDPVRVKSEGCESSLPKHIADLFPDELIESDLGPIPKGWDLTTWGTLVSLEYGKALRGYDTEMSIYPVYGTNGRIGTHSKPLCLHPGVIVGRKGAYRGVHYCPSPFFAIDTAFYLEPKVELELRWAYYDLLQRDINTMDSGSAIPSTSREDFYRLQVIFPPVFKGMHEEDLRQHFLVQLNGQYEGQATGETFNFEGKTDILIRADGKNIFIAESKFWRGPESFRETIDQLLGYASWRDTKTAILVFNRERNLSTVLAKIPEVVRAHPNFKRQLDYRSETDFRYVLHHRDDPNRELTLTILVFEIPG